MTFERALKLLRATADPHDLPNAKMCHEMADAIEKRESEVAAVAEEIAGKAGWRNLAAGGIPLGLARHAIVGVLAEQMDDWAGRLRRAKE